MIYLLYKSIPVCGHCTCCEEVQHVLYQDDLDKKTIQEYQQDWINYTQADGLEETLKKDPANLTKRGTVRFTVLERERRKYKISLREYLVKFGGFREKQFQSIEIF